MITTMTITKYLPVAVLFVLVLLAVFLLSRAGTAEADVTNQNPATVATTSVALVGNTPVLLYATSTCASRTISTASTTIMLGFGERTGFVPSAQAGFWQAASTTETYDASQFGCGAVRVYSSIPALITIQEAR
jgi:hypothetical protein